MAITRRHKPTTEFSLASISDIVFLLLIFFMLTSSFVHQAGVKVELPQGSSTKPTTAGITVTITKDGKYYLNDSQIKRKEVAATIKRAFKKEKQKMLTLRTDKEVKMQDAALVISTVAEVGGSVTIATRK